MKNQPYLLLDMHGLAHRAFHSTGQLSSGVLYGLFRDIVTFQEEFKTGRMLFCFDKGRSLRYDIYPDYKWKRNKKKKERTREERKAYKELDRQIRALRKHILPDLGFRNIFATNGYEADDIIASIIKNSFWFKDRTAVIISADTDLYQLILRDKVTTYNPRTRKLLTEAEFVREYRCRPHYWGNVKAVMGCETDSIEGISGIGLKTATKFFSRDDGEVTLEKQHRIMYGSGYDIWVRNGKLTKLPFEGTPVYKLVDDHVTEARWRRVMKSLGMRSLIDNIPRCCYA